MDFCQHLAFLIDDIARLYTRLLRSYSLELSLEPLQCRVLLALAASAGVSQARLAQICGLTAAQTTHMVDLLERQGWVERHPDPGDRRAHRLAVTVKALHALPRVSWAVGDANSQALQHFSAQEMDTLMRLVERMRANLHAPVPVAANTR